MRRIDVTTPMVPVINVTQPAPIKIEVSHERVYIEVIDYDAVA